MLVHAIAELGVQSVQAAASASLVEKLAAHLEALWPVSDVVGASALHAGSKPSRRGKIQTCQCPVSPADRVCAATGRPE